jgi:putative thioredoxin
MEPVRSFEIRDVDEAAFASEVLEASRARPVVVDFWAEWCGPCHQLSPILERVAERYADGVELVKVDVDAAPGVAGQYGIRGIPAVKAFRDGAVVAEFTGVQPEAQVDRFFAALVPSPADRLAAEAADAAPEARERLLREALERDPGHAGALVGLAELLGDRGEEGEARALLARAPADADARRLLARLNLAGAGAVDLDDLARRAGSGDAGALLELGQAYAAMEDYGQALHHLVAVARLPDTRDEARRRVLDIFALLGDDHELVRTWRPKLATALF